nr:LysR substrate-binding domain-containing protein [Aquabacterium terrae]
MVRQIPHAAYRRVLVPVDFSEWSRSSIDLAQKVAPQATLVLTHAVEIPYEGRLRLSGVAESVLARYRQAAVLEARARLQGVASVKVTPRLRTNSGDTCRVAALHDQGIGLQPSFLIGPDLLAGTLVEVMPAWRSIDLGVYAVCPSRKFVAPRSG